MNILITGVTSFLGSYIVREFISEGHTVYAILRHNSKNKDNIKESVNCHIIECDMCDITSLDNSGIDNIDACIHLSWDGLGADGRMNPLIQELNVANTIRLIKTVKKLGCKRFIMAGSQAEYGITDEHSVLKKDDKIYENTECKPVSYYGKAKRQVLKDATKLCRDLDMIYIHMRIFSIYGPGDHDTAIIAQTVKGCIEHRNLEFGPCSQLWNYMYVTDCARAVSALLNYNIGTCLDDNDCVFNIASDETKILSDFVLLAKKVIGTDNEIKFLEKKSGLEGTPYLNPSIEKLKSLTGFECKVTFEEGIRYCEEMYRLWS